MKDAGPLLQEHPANRTQRSAFPERNSGGMLYSHACCMAMHELPWIAECNERGASCQKWPGTGLRTSSLVAASFLQFSIPAGREESMCTKTSHTRSELALPYPFGTEGPGESSVFQIRSGDQMFRAEPSTNPDLTDEPSSILVFASLTRRS